MRIWNKIKNKFKKKEETKPMAPHTRGYVVWTGTAKWKGITDETNKVIIIISENKLVREYPYDEILVEKIEQVERIPIDDLTLEEEEFETEEEIDPAEINFES